MAKEVCNHCDKTRKIDNLMEMDYYKFRRKNLLVYYCYTCAIEIAIEVLNEVEILVK